MEDNSRGSRSICILKDKGVCLKVPHYKGTPKEPMFVRIPYFEFLAQTRMNRTNTCDMFVKGDIVRIYTRSLSQSPNYVAVVTVLKRKSSNLYIYKRKMADVLKNLPEPQSSEPLYRSFEVDGLGIINQSRIVPMPIECYRISMKQKDASSSTSTSSLGNDGEGEGGNQSTVWVERGLFHEGPSIADDALTTHSKSSQENENRNKSGKEDDEKKDTEKSGWSSKTNAAAATQLAHSDSEMNAHQDESPPTNELSTKTSNLCPNNRDTDVELTSTSVKRMHTCNLEGENGDGNDGRNGRLNVRSTPEAYNFLSGNGMCDRMEYYTDPLSCSSSPHFFDMGYPYAQDPVPMHPFSVNTQVHLPTTCSITPASSSTPLLSVESPTITGVFNDSFVPSPFHLSMDSFYFNDGDKDDFYLSQLKYYMGDVNNDGENQNEDKNTTMFIDNNDKVKNKVILIDSDDENSNKENNNCIDVTSKNFGKSGVCGRVQSSSNSPLLGKKSFSTLIFSDSDSDECYYGPLNSQIEENLRPQTCTIL